MGNFSRGVRTTDWNQSLQYTGMYIDSYELYNTIAGSSKESTSWQHSRHAETIIPSNKSAGCHLQSAYIVHVDTGLVWKRLSDLHIEKMLNQWDTVPMTHVQHFFAEHFFILKNDSKQFQI
jgi:hypothetical protein